MPVQLRTVREDQMDGYSNLELVKHDTTANAPEPDRSMDAPEVNHPSEAPEAS